MRLYLIAALAVFATVIGIASTFQLAPPKALTMAAGSTTGGYHRVARAYRDILAEDGIDLTVLETAGSVENAALLAAGEADIALLQGGIVSDGGTQGAEALGSVFYEPVFIFHNRANWISPVLSDWAGLRIAAGSPGSGTRAAVMALLAAGEVDEGANTLEPVSGGKAADALIAGDVDVAIFVAPLTAPYLEALYQHSEMEMLEAARLDAIASRMTASSVTVLPEGGVSYRAPAPPRDLRVLVLVARLVARADLHPSLVNRLVAAMERVHAERDALTADQQFPSLEAVSMPADVYAQKLLREGPSPVEQFLPYWVAAQISRFAILLLPIVFLLLPLLRVLPGVYQWRMRARVYRHYEELLQIDEQSLDETDPAALDRLLSKLSDIDRDLVSLRLPLPYRDYAYSTRLHIDFVRRRIQSKQGQPVQGAAFGRTG